MKSLMRLLAASALCLALTACMTTTYMITTTDGQTYIAHQNPTYDVASDTYAFTDENGKEVTLEKQEIKLIKEQ